MSRTFGKISYEGQDLTEFVPVRIKSELGMSTGHARIPEHISTQFKAGPYMLQLKDQQQFQIHFSGVIGLKAYFYAVTKEQMAAI